MDGIPVSAELAKKLFRNLPADGPEQKFIYAFVVTLAGVQMDVDESCFKHFVDRLEVCKPEFEVCKHSISKNPNYEIHNYFLFLETGAKQLVAGCCYKISEEEI